MKKVFSVFMIFFAVFLVSCGGLLGEDSTNTVRITMPGNARSASAGGPEDVDYYNIQIASQSFSIVPPGSTVESAPLPVGMSVSISVEAIGKITTNSTSEDQSSGTVGVTTKTVVFTGRVAYYQTSERLPAEGLTLNVNMANYKTEYCKIGFYAGNYTYFSNGNPNWKDYVYAEKGKPYTLPNYGTYKPTQGAPKKHIGWYVIMDQSQGGGQYNYKPGQAVTITDDTYFNLLTQEFASVSFDAWTYGKNINPVYVEPGKPITLTDYGLFEYDGKLYKHTGWSFYMPSTQDGQDDIPVTVGPSDTVNIPEYEPDFSFEMVCDETAIKLNIVSVIEGTIVLPSDGSIVTRNGENGQPTYYVWLKKPFTLPNAKRENENQELVDVTEWYLPNQNTARAGTKATFQDSEWEYWEENVSSGIEIYPVYN